MQSIKFPKMFNQYSTNIVKDSEATKQNLKLLLGCERKEFIFDPYFGLSFKHNFFEQNSYLIKDILIDDIYTQISLFMPQLTINRNDIDIVQNKEKGKIYVNIKATNNLNFTTDMYSLVLYEGNE